MEGGAFLSDAMQKAFGRFVEIKLHTDGGKNGIQNRRYQRERFETIAIPYYVLLDPTGEKIYWEAGGVQSEEDFLAALLAVPK